MDAFNKQVQFLDHTRRYSISVTLDGWELREERDSQVVRQAHYQDWHRVERVQRLIANELDDLQAQGWTEIGSEKRELRS